MKIAKNKDLILASVGFALIFMGFGAAQQFILPAFSESGSERLALVSLIILYLSFTISSQFSPKIISRLGSRKTFLLSGLSYGLYILSIYFKNEYLLYLFSFLIGVGASMIWTNIGSYIIRIVSTKDRGQALGFQTAVFMMGNLAGLAIATILVNLIEVQLIFILLGAFSLAGLLPFFAIKDAKIDVKSRSFSDVLSIFKTKSVMLLVLPAFLTFFLWAQLSTSVGLVVKQSFGITYVGVVGIILFLTMFLFAYPLGLLTKRAKKESILIVALLSALIGLLGFILQLGLFVSLASIALMSIYTSTAFPVSLNLLKDLSAKDSETVAASFTLVNSLGVLSAFISISIFKEIVTLHISLVGSIIALISLFILSRRL